MANNKVIDKEGNVLLDLTGDDVTAADVMSGKKFHGRDGVQATGSYTPVDLSTDTATVYDVRLGKTFHSGDGVQKTGTYDPGTNALAEAWEAFKVTYPTNWSSAFSAKPEYSSKYNFLSRAVNFDGLDFSGQPYSTASMFAFCTKLERAPLFDTSRVSTATNMFNNCDSLKVIPAYDFSNVSSDFSNAFFPCSSLEEFHAYGMKVSFYIAKATLLTKTALVEILNNLATVSSTQTLTMGGTNLKKLTAEEKAIATNKGWTLA